MAVQSKTSQRWRIGRWEPLSERQLPATGKGLPKGVIAAQTVFPTFLVKCGSIDPTFIAPDAL
jgi:hypothetical protein